MSTQLPQAEKYEQEKQVLNNFISENYKELKSFEIKKRITFTALILLYILGAGILLFYCNHSIYSDIFNVDEDIVGRIVNISITFFLVIFTFCVYFNSTLNEKIKNQFLDKFLFLFGDINYNLIPEDEQMPELPDFDIDLSAFKLNKKDDENSLSEKKKQFEEEYKNEIEEYQQQQANLTYNIEYYFKKLNLHKLYKRTANRDNIDVDSVNIIRGIINGKNIHTLQAKQNDFSNCNYIRVENISNINFEIYIVPLDFSSTKLKAVQMSENDLVEITNIEFNNYFRVYSKHPMETMEILNESFMNYMVQIAIENPRTKIYASVENNNLNVLISKKIWNFYSSKPSSLLKPKTYLPLYLKLETAKEIAAAFSK